jgi:nitrite reductase (NADH) small subunit
VFYASTAVCPHAGGPLGDGGLNGSALTCPYHGWAFDVRDGSCVVDPNVRLATFEVWVRGDELYVRR